MESIEEPLMLSALEHYAYCPRQCGLIHLEQVFDENIYTLRGAYLHRYVDQPGSKYRGEGKVEYAMPLWSKRLNLIGKADIVEFRNDGTIYPVEYKSGSKRASLPEKIQLCAQALCLEEMFDCSIEKGALFWFGSQHRIEVVLNEQLRTETLNIITQTRKMLISQILPPPVHDQRCQNCSLVDACMPELETSPSAFHKLFEVDDETAT
jgi:CRISPR-associated exonuclease Cas4